jgi:hypothetical protein
MNVERTRDPKRTPAVSRVARWRPGYWLVALALVAVGEALVTVQFVEARHAYELDIVGPCPDECLGTWFTMLFWGAIMFIWPIAGVISAGIVKLVWMFVVWAWDQFRSHRAPSATGYNTLGR